MLANLPREAINLVPHVSKQSYLDSKKQLRFVYDKINLVPHVSKQSYLDSKKQLGFGYENI